MRGSRRLFSRRTAVVTGGVRRIGLAIARELAREGAALVLTYYRSTPSEVRQAVDDLEREGSPKVSAYQADLSRQEGLDSLLEQLSANHPRVDFLVNSAANFPNEGFFDTSYELFDETIALNLRAPFFLARHVARGMKEHGFGRIVNIADVAGVVPWKGYVAYSISKGALIAATKAMSKALAPEVLVNCVAPGPVLLPESFGSSEVREALEPTLLKRPGSPEEVADAVVYLLSSDYVTGIVLPVDGGRLLR
jgi:pteridine reductase